MRSGSAATASSQEALLCMALMRADTEVEVIEILKKAGYWDDSDAWRLFSDNDNSFSVIGNQQSEAVAAFVEKIINSVDARLVNACYLAGCDPEGPDAPQSMRESVARFFEGKPHPKDADGRISDWIDGKATSEGRLLTVAATGKMPRHGQPSLTVADQGEGQTPDDFPNTFMSIQRNNKLRIPFVQGKFNMGGTGALQFSKLQLVISRRNPALLRGAASARDRQWGFTVVRREWPPGGSKSSVFRYLAPVRVAESTLRGVLAFAADEWPIFPEANRDIRDAYQRPSPYGSLVKLYEYTWQGTKSNIVFSGDGLLRRIDIGLPELALPVRLFECRKEYPGHGGSFATNALGLVARLDRDREGNIEDEPIGGVIALDDGKQIRLRVYVFQDADKAKQYRNPRHGVVFGVNGQMHASYRTDFFSRNSVNLSYLKDSLLVFADCSAIDGRTREDLFMNSRDRLRDTGLSRQLEKKLESFLRNEPTLRVLQNRRRQRAIQDKLKDDKPLSDVLQGLMKKNPILSKMFLQGLNLSAPFPPTGGKGGGKKGTADVFLGKRYPTYFRFKDRKEGEALVREARLNTRARVSFETDAEDAYFVRDVDPGAWNVRCKVGDEYIDAAGWITTGPKSGIAQLWFDSLPDGTRVGDHVEYLVEVTDPSRIDSFQLELRLDVVPSIDSSSGTRGSSHTANAGRGELGGAGSTLSLPNIKLVRRHDWQEHDFGETSALKVIHAGTAKDTSAPVYDFFVNIDNKYLLHSQKERTASAALLEKQFVYGFVLIGLAFLQDHHHGGKRAAPDSEGIDAYVERATRALGPILVPMIQAIGSLED